MKNNDLKELVKSIKTDNTKQKLFDYRLKYNYCVKCGKTATHKINIFSLCEKCYNKIKVNTKKILKENEI